MKRPLPDREGASLVVYRMKGLRSLGGLFGGRSGCRLQGLFGPWLGKQEVHAFGGGFRRLGQEARRNELADDDVLLEADELVLLAGDGRLGEDPGGLLEGGRRQPAIGVQRDARGR